MQQQGGASEFIGLDTSQPFAALNMRSDGSRVLATAVVIGVETAILLWLRCQATAASRDDITASQL